jgi:hypothetical protein
MGNSYGVRFAMEFMFLQRGNSYGVQYAIDYFYLLKIYSINAELLNNYRVWRAFNCMVS